MNMTSEYYIIIDERQVGPLSLEDLRAYHLSPDSLVWKSGLPDWVKASVLPELADIIAVDTPYQDIGNHSEENRWFAMINGVQVGPYSIERLISMGLTPSTPVWRNGISDWVEASSRPEIMRHFQSTPPPHTGADYAHNPQYGRPSDYSGYNGEPNFAKNPQYGQPRDYRNEYPGANNFNNADYGRNQDNNRGNNGMSSGPVNWLPWAIVATILAFLFSCIGVVFGIIAIVNANKANQFYANGYNEMGDQANSTARTMTIIGLVLGGIGLLLTGALYKYPLSFMSMM